MKKLLIYLDTKGDGSETKFLGTLNQDGVITGDKNLKRDIEKILKFNSYNLYDPDDWFEITCKLSDTLTHAIEVVEQVEK